MEEINGDLFKQKDFTCSYAHCVAKDLDMGRGIAVRFKNIYKSVDELKAQDIQVGSVGILKNKGDFIYYLVTKTYSGGKPTLHNLEKSLICMKIHAVKNNVKIISMPKIGCGLDKLDWVVVKQMLNNIFSDTDIKLKIYWI